MAATWYFRIAGQQYGPVAFADLQQFAATGQLCPDDLVSPDQTDWSPARENPHLALSFNSNAAPRVAVAGSEGASGSLGMLSYPAPGLNNPAISNHAINLIGQTSPWVRIISVLIFVGISFMIAAFLVMLYISSRTGQSTPLMLGVFYLAASVLYLVPAIYLWRYASRAREFARTREESLLVDALQAQKSFWKYVAIAALIIIGLYAMLIPFVLLSAVAGPRIR